MYVGKKGNSPGSSSALGPRIWKEFWRAPVNPRIRNFLWRVTKNIISTKDNLLRRGMQLEGSFSLCNSCSESAQHVFLHCEFAGQVIFDSILSYRLPVSFEETVLVWIGIPCLLKTFPNHEPNLYFGWVC